MRGGPIFPAPAPAGATPKVRIDYGTGTPAGMPDYRPVNPWGRPMPKPTRPMRAKPIEESLYRVVVETQEKGVRAHKPVGPKVGLAVAERLLVAINAQIALGNERVWSSPRLEKVAG